MSSCSEETLCLAKKVYVAIVNARTCNAMPAVVSSRAAGTSLSLVHGRRRLATCTCGSLKIKITLLDGRRGAEIVRKVNVPVREFYSCSGLVSLVYNPVVGNTCISGLSKLFVEKLTSLCLGGKRVLSP